MVYWFPEIVEEREDTVIASAEEVPAGCPPTRCS
jgi:hypothetical protein